jgi:hypothetical protein
MREMMRELSSRMGPGDVLVIRGSLSARASALQWRLLPFADRIIETQGRGYKSIAPGARRVWVLDSREDYVPSGTPEPEAIFPDAPEQEFSANDGWRTVEHRRVRCLLPGRKPLVFRHICDVYLCEAAEDKRDNRLFSRAPAEPLGP